MHYYQFNIGDYASHTRHLEPMEDLIYRRLLDLYYLHERPLNEDASVVAKQIGLRDMAATVRDVLNEFFERTDDGYRSARADKEIAHYHSKIEQASKAGKASAERRTNARSTDVQPTNNQEPITNNHKPKKEKATDVAFELPDWIPLETWNAFIDMRKRIKKPATDFAKKLIVGKLEKFKAQGHDVVAILEKSITSGWQDVFEPKENKSFAQQAADIVRTTVPPANKGPDPALVKIEQDRAKAVPMPAHIRQQLMSVTRKI